MEPGALGFAAVTAGAVAGGLLFGHMLGAHLSDLVLFSAAVAVVATMGGYTAHELVLRRRSEGP